MSAKSLPQNAENELNPLTMSDEQILEQIYSTHVHSDTKFDVDSLLTLVENILRRSTNIVDNVVQVTFLLSSMFFLHIYVPFNSNIHALNSRFLAGIPCTLGDHR